MREQCEAPVSCHPAPSHLSSLLQHDKRPALTGRDPGGLHAGHRQPLRELQRPLLD